MTISIISPLVRVYEQPVRLRYYAKFSDNAGVRIYGSTLQNLYKP